jgi:hypothetical protein
MDFGLWIAWSRPPTRRTVPLDRIHQLSVPAVLAFHVHGDDGVQRRNQQQHVEDQSEDKARHDEDEVQDGRERLPVEQKGERWKEGRQNVDDRKMLRPERMLLCRVQPSQHNGRRRARAMRGGIRHRRREPL